MHGASTNAAAAGPMPPASRSPLWRSRSRSLLAAISGCGLAALLVPAVHPPALRAVWNVTASVPLGLYRVDRLDRPSPGMLVAWRPTPSLAHYMARRRYVEQGALLVKPIAAVAGQSVCRHDAVVTIDGAPIARALEADRFHRALPTWSGCHRLKKTELFVLAPKVAASFDSRYFGPIEIKDVVGRAVPLWVRP